VAVSKLGESRCSERNLGERRQPLVDEPLEPAQRRAFVGAGSAFASSSLSESAVASEKSAHLPCGHLCGLDMTAMDGALEASVCCALAGHLAMPLGLRPGKILNRVYVYALTRSDTRTMLR
jgi:hypothetical protein